jgi:hypothetical protein
VRLPSARLAPLALAAAAAVLAASLALAALVSAQGSPTPGGTVPSTLALSLSGPSPFRRIGRTNAYIATVRARLTATDVPSRLSLTEGEAETPLRIWRAPLSGAAVKVRLRQAAPSPRALHNRRKLLFVTLTAAGP